MAAGAIGCGASQKPVPAAAKPTPASSPASAPATQPSQALLDGPWHGAVHVPGHDLGIVVRFSSQNGRLAAELDVPEQGLKAQRAKSVARQGDALAFTVDVLGIVEVSFRGTVAGDRIEGTFTQAGAQVPFSLERGLPPAPKEEPVPYKVENVRFPDGDVTLAGTLTLPPGVPKPPAVVLVAGSGRQTRDEQVAGMKIFRILADHLTRRGIAVLRYDKRGVGDSTGDYFAATTQDFAADAAAAVSYLEHRSDIDSARIGIIGHSEGGGIAPIVAARRPDVAFIVMMAGLGERGDRAMLDQEEAVNRAVGVGEAILKKQRALMRRVFARVEAGQDLAPLRGALVALAQEEDAGAAQPTSAPTAARYVDAQLKDLRSGWWRFALTYDPAPTLARVRCPVLAVNGSLDTQVVAATNLIPIRETLRKGGNKDFQAVELPGLNHLFQRAKTGSPEEYATLPKQLDPTFLTLLDTWLDHHLHPHR